MTCQQQTSLHRRICAERTRSYPAKSRGWHGQSCVYYGDGRIDVCALYLQMESTYAGACTCRALRPRRELNLTTTAIMTMKWQHS